MTLVKNGIGNAPAIIIDFNALTVFSGKFNGASAAVATQMPG